MAVVRFIIGKILLLINFVFLPKQGLRSVENIENIKHELENYSLYEFAACPFCIMVRREFYRLNLNVNLVDAKLEPFRRELQKDGGKLMAPCLRIQKGDKVTWMYESQDIMKFMGEKFPLN